MDNAKQFFDELKKKGMQQVEQAIEDWDYQDFSPDKRRALLEEQVTNDVADDLSPEADAIHHIQVSRQQLNWSGLSPDDELADFGYDSDAVATASASYEGKMVIMSTPAGGIQGVPDADTLHRFVNKAPHMDPSAVVQALASRLQDAATCWQIRSKALVLMHALIESVSLAPLYLPLFQQHAALMQQLEALRTHDHNHIVRENARKALSLVLSNGANPLHIAKDSGAAKVHARLSDPDRASTLASVRKNRAAKVSGAAAATTASKRAAAPPAPIKTNARRLQQHTTDAAAHHGHTSPKIARAALASWRRRNSQTSMDASENNPNLMPFQTPSSKSPPKPTLSASSGSTTGNIVGGASAASRYQSRQMSAFTFIQ